MRVQFTQPNGWEAEIVTMDGAVYIRARAPGSTLPWQYVLSIGEANAMAQQLQEAAAEAHRWHTGPGKDGKHVGAAAPLDGAA
jgi:hypothetical protein